MNEHRLTYTDCTGEFVVQTILAESTDQVIRYVLRMFESEDCIEGLFTDITLVDENGNQILPESGSWYSRPTTERNV